VALSECHDVRVARPAEIRHEHLRRTSIGKSMSALPRKQTSRTLSGMSAKCQ
jgi:hypothetical protein